MNRLLLTIFLAAASVSVSAQSGSTLRFDEESWDFGEIVEADGKVSHNFEFTNTGTSAVIIESVEISCGCTSASYSRPPIMPGKKGFVEVTFDPADRPGFFLKKIVVKSGKGRNVNTIEIKGSVASRARTVQENYPFDAGRGIRFATSSINFVRVGQGQAKSMKLGYINTSDKEVRLRIAPCKGYPWLRIIAPERICGGCAGEIVFTIDLTQTTLWGAHTIPADIYVSDNKHNKDLTVSVLATDDFEAISGVGPRSKLDHQFFHFGDVSVGDKSLSREFTLTNEGDSPLIVRAVQYDDGVTSSLREGSTVAPGDRLRFTVTIDLGGGAKSSDRLTRSVTLTLNDPTRPIREIRLVANTGWNRI